MKAPFLKCLKLPLGPSLLSPCSLMPHGPSFLSSWAEGKDRQQGNAAFSDCWDELSIHRSHQNAEHLCLYSLGPHVSCALPKLGHEVFPL